MRLLDWFIALRYLFSRERRTLLSVNTLISVAGVAVGVAVLVVTTGVMDGATELLFGRITSLFPHVTIVRNPDSGQPPLDTALADALRKDPRVAFAEPILTHPTMIQPRKGIETEKDMVDLQALDAVGSGTLFQFTGANAGQRYDLKAGEVLLGQALAAKLGIAKGDEILLISFNPGSGAGRLRMRPYLCTVTDLFETGYYEFDASMGFVSPDQMLKMYPDAANDRFIHVRMNDPNEAGVFAAGLNLPPGYRASTWIENDAQFFAALKFQKYMLLIILLLIVVVASLNIIGTLVLMVFEKTREIGILKALGCSRMMVARVFVLDGMLIGLAGTTAGVGLGLLVSAGLRAYEFKLPAAVYNFGALPVKNDPLGIVIIAVSALAICTLASLLPALGASRLNPVEALRYE